MRGETLDGVLDTVGRNWWLLVLRGIASILFGLAVIVRPEASMVALLFIFGIYAIVDGLLSILLAFRGESVAWSIIRGIISITAGVLAFRYPGITLALVYTLIGIWAISIGIAEIITAAGWRGGRAAGIGILTGLVSIAIGVLLFVHPPIGLALLLGFLAAYAIIHGILMISAGVDIHHFANERRLIAQH
jgi:uncharacterized membrane protein HdeD (DUF308 family)